VLIGDLRTIIQWFEERVFEPRQKNLFNQIVGKFSSTPVGQKDLFVAHELFTFCSIFVASAFTADEFYPSAPRPQ
jgi:hypothetical protein